MGNLSCGCSDVSRENTLYNMDKEEIIEFNSELFPHPTENPVLAVLLPNPPKVVVNISIEGELFRYQKASKEILIPRWCVLSHSTFKYHKSHYSAVSKEKPLFEISVEKLNFFKFYKHTEKFFMQLSFYKTVGLSSSSSISSISSRPTLIYKHSRTPSNLSLCEESLTFVIKSKPEWDRWKASFSKIQK